MTGTAITLLLIAIIELAVIIYLIMGACIDAGRIADLKTEIARLKEGISKLQKKIDNIDHVFFSEKDHFKKEE